jgi:polysaccharide deacetylase 2 family uncharacterized protein YibQ
MLNVILTSALKNNYHSLSRIFKRKYNLKLLVTLLFIGVSLFDPLRLVLNGASLPKISVIIDDVGDNQRLGYRATKLPIQVALSILPHTPFSHELAVIGHNRGMDILLHQPMESFADKRLLGPGALLSRMERQEFAHTLDNNLKSVPFVIGINNHMGSLLTSDSEKMNWLMAELKLRDIFFIDSRTTSRSIAGNTAQKWNIPTMSRKVFLDHYDDPIAIAKQFQRLLQIAEKHGHATAIGHPRKNTLEFLEQQLPQLISNGFKLVSPSEAMQNNVSNNMVDNQSIAKTNSVPVATNCNKLISQQRFKIIRMHTMETNLLCAHY